ncbi:MAG: hypothetical protein J0L75_13125 [Spirochaetes bacterium]|nr:hypothetical protein [Spirochaetota bacterium]
MPLPTDAKLRAYLESSIASRHPLWGVPGKPCKSPGYHTKVADGTPVHPTRDAAQYILMLLMEGSKESLAQAASALPHLLALQETDPYHPAYGIWPWFYEEPIPQMSPPDWNWADFIGAQLIQIWSDYHDRLPAPLEGELRRALLRAGWSIFRRNVQPGYTNIALMGATVTAAVGERLGVPELLEYAKARLAGILSHTEKHGDFNEYNSPTYTLVALEEMDRALFLVEDPTVRERAEILRRHAWKVIAEHFHASSGTWAGPHSRTYGDLLSPATRHLLAELAGASFSQTGTPSEMRLLEMEGKDFDLIPRLPCPGEWRGPFQAGPNALVTRRHTFVRRGTGNTASPATPQTADTIGTTALSPLGNLASVNRDSFWTQTRPIIGYWKTAGLPAVLRLRMIHNGRDFASGMEVSVQEGFRLLVSGGFALGRGDFHPGLDRGPDPIFNCSELVWRWELTAPGAEAAALGADGSALSAPGFSCRIQHPPGNSALGEHPWTRGTAVDPADGQRNVAFAELALYRGPAKEIDLRKLGPFLLLSSLNFGEVDSPAVALRCADSIAQWGDLSLAPLREAVYV